jgi:hypothetical protein
MPKKKEEPRDEVNIEEVKLLAELQTHYNESEKFIAEIRDNNDFSWDDREKLLIGELTDFGSSKSKSKVNTGDLVNLVFDGASRVMAQFPTGRIQAMTQDDKGKNLMMNLVHEKYIIPNADSQFDLLTKLRVWSIYSRVFGSMPALVDYRVDDDYIGPDLWILHPRNVFPQPGATNGKDMQYCQVSTWVDMDYLKGRDKKIWKNIDELIGKVKEGGKTKQQMDSKYLPVNERLGGDLLAEEGKFAQCELITEYRKDRWITYSKEYNLIVRDIPNPQGNNELPIVWKHCFPLIDRLYGLAEFERGKTLQFAANSLVNMYLEGVAMSIFPPLLLDKNGIVASSIEYKHKAKWLMTKPNSISQLQLSPQGMNTFNSTYSFLKSQILNLGATTDTSISKDVDPGKGKTPEALKQQSAREGARDAWDRFMMERALEEVNQKFIDLLTTKQEKPIDIELFKDDVEKIQKAYPDEQIATVFSSGEAGMLQVTADQWQDEKGTIKFKYYVDSGSTMKKDDQEEHMALVDIMALVLKFPSALQQIEQSGKFQIGDKTFDFGETLKRYVITSGIQDGEKIIHENEESPEQMNEQQNAQMQLQQMQQQIQQITEALGQIAEKVEKPEKDPAEQIKYDKAPDSIKRQMEAKAGFTPSTDFSVGEGEDPVQKGLNFIQDQEAISQPVPNLNQNIQQ